MSLIEPLLDAVQCKECLKSMYKNSKRPFPTTPVREFEPPASQKVMVQSPDQPSIKQCPRKAETPMEKTDEDMDQEEPQMLEIPNTSDDTELCFLGASVFGTKLKTVDLKRCEELASSPEKLALNLLEFLVTREDCQGMTVYGHGKKTKAMDENMRRAIKSHIFNIYKKELTPEEKNKFWMEKIVYKMNDKIRKIRNGRYSGKN